MSLSRYPQITDALLSAYLDNDVSEAERALIERAIVDDAEIAWRLDSLRQTVQLLHTLPAVSLPRSFTLDAAMVKAHALREEQEAHASRKEQVAHVLHEAEQSASKPMRVGELYRLSEQPAGWWQNLIATLQRGTPVLRLATTVTVLLLAIWVTANWILPSWNTREPVNEVAILSAPSAETDAIEEAIEVNDGEDVTTEVTDSAEAETIVATPLMQDTTIAADVEQPQTTNRNTETNNTVETPVAPINTTAAEDGESTIEQPVAENLATMATPAAPPVAVDTEVTNQPATLLQAENVQPEGLVTATEATATAPPLPTSTPVPAQPSQAIAQLPPTEAPPFAFESEEETIGAAAVSPFAESGPGDDEQPLNPGIGDTRTREAAGVMPAQVNTPVERPVDPVEMTTDATAPVVENSDENETVDAIGEDNIATDEMDQVDTEEDVTPVPTTAALAEESSASARTAASAQKTETIVTPTHTKTAGEVEVVAAASQQIITGTLTATATPTPLPTLAPLTATPTDTPTVVQTKTVTPTIPATIATVPTVTQATSTPTVIAISPLSAIQTPVMITTTVTPTTTVTITATQAIVTRINLLTVTPEDITK